MQLKIGTVAAETGVAASTLRYYERIGLLRPAERVSGQRRYEPEVVDRLALIGVAQRAGLALGEIGALLDAGDDVSGQLRALAARKLPLIEALIADAKAVKRWLDIAATCRCESVHKCGLFDEALVGDLPEGPAHRRAFASSSVSS